MAKFLVIIKVVQVIYMSIINSFEVTKPNNKKKSSLDLFQNRYVKLILLLEIMPIGK